MVIGVPFFKFIILVENNAISVEEYRTYLIRLGSEMALDLMNGVGLSIAAIQYKVEIKDYGRG